MGSALPSRVLTSPAYEPPAWEVLVFPGVLFLAVNFFITGLTSASVSLVAGDYDCGLVCKLPGVLVLVFVALYMLLCLALVLHYHRTHGAATWAPAEDPIEPHDVSDPLYRWVSQLRMRWCRCACLRRF